MNIGFLGAGTITSAMVTGLHAAGGGGYSVRVSPRNAAVAAELAGRCAGVQVAASNQEAVDESETVVIAVRPQVTEEVLRELRFRGDQHVISLVSGFSVGRLAGLVAPASRITRAVPLPAAARRRSPTAIYPRDGEAVELFALLGAAFAVETESAFDALCTATATMAAYFAFADGAASWLAEHGITEEQAREYIGRIFAGLGETALERPDESFAALAADHATRGGTNEQVLRHLTEHGVWDRFAEALDGVMRRVTAASRG
jgi:pyrroline-5-carboxylate reductase